MKYSSAAVLAAVGSASAAAVERRQAPTTTASGSSSSTVPQYFQTSPELYAGPTPTGSPAFLAATNPAPFAQQTYIPPAPLETQQPIMNSPPQGNIFQLQGQLSHYFANPNGFGVDEFALPQGANITSLYMLSRHGSRYPTDTSTFVQKLVNNTGKYNATGQLSFLNNWTYKLGAQILTPVGRSELYDSGVQHAYNYGHLYPNNGTKIVARSTTQDRMTKSAENFLAGFFGLEWTKNATLELIIEQTNFNNSLAAYDVCPNNNLPVSNGGLNASVQWENIYLQDAQSRLAPLIKSSAFNLTIADVYSMQSLCAYETVALGYSKFCDLFSWDEWEGYEYSVDLDFAGTFGFQSPTGRAVGIGWAQELIARLKHQYLNSSAASSVNVTLDSMPSTFPLYQALNFDFTHDVDIMADLTALGLKQFAKFLPATHIVERDLIVSHLEPFGARVDIEVINTPHPINPANVSQLMTSGPPSMYIHFLINQRTLPLHKSYDACPYLANGWCEMGNFFTATKDIVRDANYQYACFGNYSAVPYGTITNGAPLPRNSSSH